jgi:hypothetical protein
MGARRGYLASIKGQSSAVALANEATTATGNISYQITSSTKRILDYNTAVVVKVGGSAVTTGFTISYLTGTVTFDSASVRTVTITGAYVVLTEIANAKSFNFSGARETLDKTIFKDVYRAYEAGLLTGTAELGLFYTDAYFFTWLTDNSVKVIEYYVDDAITPIRFYAVISEDSANIPVEGLVDQKISMQITKEIGGLI